MKRLSKTIVCTVLVTMLVGGTVVNAVSPGQGLKGSQNKILSQVTTFAGNGVFTHKDGNALTASFRTPHSIVTLPDGSVLISDSRNQIIRKIRNGEVTNYAGITFDNDALGLPQGGWHDDDKEISVFHLPSGMTADEDGNVYIADAENSLIRKISTNGNVTTVAGGGFIGDQDGAGEKARFYYPQDVAVAKDGTLYVADTLNHLIRKITINGEVSTLNTSSTRPVEAGAGSIEPGGDYLDGNLKEAKFNEPSGLAIDSKGNLYVSDTGNQLIRYIDLEANKVTTVAGNIRKSSSITESNRMYAEGGYADGAALEALFHFPKGLAMTDEGGVLIADSLNHAIRYLLDGEVITLAGDPGSRGNVDGINGYNQLHNPTGVAVQQDGSILIADSYNNRIRQFSLYKLPDNLPQNNQVKVVIGSEIVTFDAQPEIINGRTMIPVRFPAEVLGYELEFEHMEKAVILSKDDIRVKFNVDQPSITVTKEGTKTEEKRIDTVPYIKESRTFIPLRIFSEEFGLDVQWNQDNQTVILREKE